MTRAFNFMRLNTFLLLLLVVSSGAFAQDRLGTNTVAQEEREALVALYNATGGPQWTNKSGWLGLPGSECEWHGVLCVPSEGGEKSTLSVFSVELSNNNLVGAIPAELGDLKRLASLSVFGNRLSGSLPEPLIERWLSRPLHIGAEA